MVQAAARAPHAPSLREASGARGCARVVVRAVGQQAGHVCLEQGRGSLAWCASADVLLLSASLCVRDCSVASRSSLCAVRFEARCNPLCAVRLELLLLLDIVTGGQAR